MKLSNRDYLWSYIGVFLSLSANIIMVPFIMYYLDGDHYGLWGVFQSLVGITVLFDFGFSTTFGRNINYCWNGAERLEKTGAVYSTSKEPNFYLMKKTMAACQRVFLIISGCTLLLLLTVGTLYIRHISAAINPSESITAWTIYAVAIFMNLYFGYYNAFLRGVGAIEQVNKAMVYARIAQIGLTIVLLMSGLGLIGTGIAYLAYGTLFRVIGKREFYNYKGIGKGLKSITVKIPGAEIKDTFITVWYNAWRDGIVSLANYLAGQASTIIVSLYMPLTQTGAYSLGIQITTAIAQIAGAMYRSNQPILQSAYINNDKEGQRRTMSLIIVSFSILDISGLLFATLIGLPLLRLIRPETVVAPLTLLGLGIYQFVLYFRNCYASYFSCTNRLPYVKAFLISSITGVALSMLTLGVLNMGIWGIIVAQLISQGAYNAWYWTLKAHQEMELSFHDTVYLGFDEIKKVVRSIFRKLNKNRA